MFHSISSIIFVFNRTKVLLTSIKQNFSRSNPPNKLTIEKLRADFKNSLL